MCSRCTYQKEMAATITMSEMQKALECSICLQELVDPKVLPCQHTFCKVCMDTILHFNEDGSATVNCPLRCDGNTMIARDKTTNDLAAPFQLKHILDILKRGKCAVSAGEIICNGSASCKNAVSTYCKNCDEYYCRKCNHEHSKTHIHNKYLPIKFDKQNNSLRVFCTEHDSFADSICCDSTFVCVYCKHRNHHGHAAETIDNEATIIKNRIDDEKAKIPQITDSINKTLRLTEQYIVECRNVLRRSLRNRKIKCLSEYIVHLKDEEKRLLREFDTLTDTHLRNYPEMPNLEYFDDITREQNNVHIALQKDTILNKLANLSPENIRIPTLTVNLSPTNHADASPLGNFTVANSDGNYVDGVSSVVVKGFAQEEYDVKILKQDMKDFLTEVSKTDNSKNEPDERRRSFRKSLRVASPPASTSDVRRKVDVPTSPEPAKTLHEPVRPLTTVDMKQTTTLLMLPPDQCCEIMGSKKGFPQKYGVGEMYVGNVDEKFAPDELITWRNNSGKAGRFQYLGWLSEMFHDKTVVFRFWIKFIQRVPKPSEEFGIEVDGEVYNEFVDNCTQANMWYHVEKTVKCSVKRDVHSVMLTFSSIPHRQTVRISQMKLEILDCKQEIV